MKYSIGKVEIINGKGKTWKTAILTTGDMSLEVSVWPDFPDYDKVVEGGEVEGVIREKGQYKNLVSGNLGAKTFTPKIGAITKAMDKKAENIEKAQSHRDAGIKISSTIRMAVDIAVAQGNVEKENIHELRKWLWVEWDNIEDFPPF